MKENKSYITLWWKEFPYKWRFSWSLAEWEMRRKDMEDRWLDPFVVACENVSRAMKNPEVRERVIQRLKKALA